MAEPEEGGKGPRAVESPLGLARPFPLGVPAPSPGLARAGQRGRPRALPPPDRVHPRGRDPSRGAQEPRAGRRLLVDAPRGPGAGPSAAERGLARGRKRL